MKQFRFRSLATPMIALALVCTMALPTSAFLWFGKDKSPTVVDFAKNGITGESITFTRGDFPVVGGKQSDLVGITIVTLPAEGAGSLLLGSELVLVDDFLDDAQLEMLRFQISATPTMEETTFQFIPTFDGDVQGKEAEITIHLLTEPNDPPIAKNIELSTYKNVNINGIFDAVDNDGDTLTFQLTSTPARGAITMTDNASAQFVYTPYENKTGKDAFTYVAIDPAGNVSSEAKVTIQIEKPATSVVYTDMAGDPAHKAAVRLAEEGIYVGKRINDEYFFDSGQPITRNEFLSLAMSVTGMEPLEGVKQTGFYDDTVIPTWAKGYVSAALMAGAVSGNVNAEGQPVFGGDTIVTQAEATVMLNQLLGVSDVVVDDAGHWADQATANLATAGVLSGGATGDLALATLMTRGQVAEMLDGAMDVIATREESEWIIW